MKRFENKFAVVSGASREGGVGAATAELLIREGAKVLMLDMDEQNGVLLQQKLGENSPFLTCDVSSEAAVK